MKKESILPLFCIIPAAGIGSRMQAEVPKQYLEIEGRTILSHTLATFLASTYVEEVVVALSKEDPYFSLDEYGAKEREKLILAEGGDTRADSVFNSLEAIRQHLFEQHGEQEGERHLAEAWVMVHDAARPGLTTEELDAFITSVWRDSSKAGAIMALPAQDTIKKVAGKRIETTLDREKIWLAQTPQMVRFNDLYNGTKVALSAGANVTDEASILEYNGIFPDVYPGKPHNFKVTYPGDLELMQLIMANRHRS